MFRISVAPATRLLAGRRAGLPDVLADGQPDALPQPTSITAPAAPAWK